jgi:ABC-type bacteriocin/lantibiotic exporter with double-glycine peptidase domain
MERFQDGDKTIVGDMGVSLSGGQKTRVALARALYRKADIYLIDEVLGALDVNVGKYVVEKCLKEHLNDALRIVVTHQLQYLPHADWVIVLNEVKFHNKYLSYVCMRMS